MKNKLQKYDNYKPSGVEWLGEIPQHWEVKKLKFIINHIQTGTTPSTSNLAFFNGDINWYNPKDLNNEILFKAEKSITVVALERREAKLFPKDSILVVGIGATTGKTSYMSDYGSFNQQITGFHSNDNNNKYLYYLLKTQSILMLSIANYTTLPILNNEFFKSLLLVFPPLSEQEKIAQFLDEKTTKIDKAIEIKQRQIELLKERRQILIHRAVTRGLDANVPLKDSGVEWIGEIPEHWEVKKLKYILHERNERSITGEEPLFMMSQIHGLVVRSDFHEKAEAALSSVGNKLVYEKDLVFNKLKAHLGVFFKSNIPQTGIVSPDYAVYYTNGIIEDVKFLEVLFRSPSYIREFICRATGIVEGLIRLYTGDLFDIAVPVPPKQEQRMILTHIENISAKISKAIGLKEREIEVLKEYKSSLINSAVTGKVKIG